MGLTLSGGSAGASLGGTTPVSAVAGVATFADLNVHTVGSAYKLTAAASGLPALTSADSSLFDITPGAATHLAFSTHPTSTRLTSRPTCTSYAVFCFFNKD